MMATEMVDDDGDGNGDGHAGSDGYDAHMTAYQGWLPLQTSNSSCVQYLWRPSWSHTLSRCPLWLRSANIHPRLTNSSLTSSMHRHRHTWKRVPSVPFLSGGALSETYVGHTMQVRPTPSPSTSLKDIKSHMLIPVNALPTAPPIVNNAAQKRSELRCPL